MNKKARIGLVCFLIIIFAGLNAVYAAQTEHKLQLFFQEEEDDPNYQFTRHGPVGIDNKGNLYIADGVEKFINKYDKSGKFLLRFGKLGNGPGEFRHLQFIQWRKDRLYIDDDTSYHYYTSEGKLISSYQKSSSKGSGILLKESLFIDRYFSRDWSEQILNIYDSKKEAITPLFKVKTEPLSRRNDRVQFGVMMTGTPLLDTEVTGDGKLYYFRNDEFKIYEFKNMKSRLLIEESIKPRKIPREKMNEDISRIKKDLKRFGFPSDDFPVYYYYPIIKRMTVDFKGNIWVLYESSSNVGIREYDQNGKFVGDYIIVNPIKTQYPGLMACERAVYLCKYDYNEGLKIYRLKL